VPSSLRLLRSIVASLEQAGFGVFVFGGWAEELHGLTPTRDHRDIDLLLLDPDEPALAAFLDTREEILEKRSTHKRAFELDGVLVELFIARSENGEPVTYFWNHLRWVWPADIGVSIVGLPVTSSASLALYRSSWHTIQAARQHQRGRAIPDTRRSGLGT
jgi:hypothetical protein